MAKHSGTRDCCAFKAQNAIANKKQQLRQKRSQTYFERPTAMHLTKLSRYAHPHPHAPYLKLTAVCQYIVLHVYLHAPSVLRGCNPSLFALALACTFPRLPVPSSIIINIVRLPIPPPLTKHHLRPLGIRCKLPCLAMMGPQSLVPFLADRELFKLLLRAKRGHF